MSSNKLPHTIYPEELCQRQQPQGVDLTGEILLGKLRNLDSELKPQKETPIKISLHFAKDDDGRCVITGEMTVDLEMVCQRCLQPMIKSVNATILVSPVSSDNQAKQLPDHYEPLLMSDGAVDLAEWIAEELHLALPFAPCHDNDCVGHLNLN
jgi:uncharacterized protein